MKTFALAPRLRVALAAGSTSLDELHAATPDSYRDLLATLLAIYELHQAPIDRLGGTQRWQHHPAVAGIKHRLEGGFVEQLECDRSDATRALPDDAVAAMRRLAAVDQVPDVYDWLATNASWTELVEFLAVEGGPDAGFDDLVAACQIGLSGLPKLALALNYWDEMGNGELADVHTELHDRLVQATAMPRIPLEHQPVEVLERQALTGLLATNRWLQPELLGALGLLELQAGPPLPPGGGSPSAPAGAGRCLRLLRGARRG